MALGEVLGKNLTPIKKKQVKNQILIEENMEKVSITGKYQLENISNNPRRTKWIIGNFQILLVKLCLYPQAIYKLPIFYLYY